MRLQVSWTVLLVVIAATLGSKGFAVDNPWTAPALSQDPKVLLKASESFALNSKTGTTILLNQMSFRFEQDGRLHQSSHMIYRIDSNEAMQALSAVRAVWQPWHQLKPTIRARVITPTGDVHALDSSSLVDSPAFEQRPELFDDFRVVGAPLPAVSVGALVETEEVYEESRPAFAGGIVRTVYVGNLAPVENTRIEILAPSDLALRYELSDLPNAHVERTADAGQLHVTIVQGPLTAVESIPQFTPGDVALVPELSFSTGQSWKEVAFAYSALVEPQIRTGDVQSLVTPIAQANKDRVAVIRELMQKLHQEVRYTGVELGISSYVPQPTATVLSRHYGDCKDKAAVLAALLRAAKIPAYLALLNPGRSEDVRPTLPGFGGFTHAIVYVPGTPDRWIDATDEYAEPDHLSAVDQGRLALIIRENTTELVKTPVSTFDQNVSINTREIDLEELGPAKGKEMFAGRGAFDEYFRRMCDLSDEKRLRETFLAQVKREFGADDVSDFHHSDARDLSKPIEVSLSMDKVPYATTTPQVAVVWMLPPPIRQWLPSPLFHDFSETGEDGEPKPSAPRTIDFVLPEAFVREWRYRLVAPPGYDVRSLPSGGTRQLGPAMLSESYEKQAEGTVVATMRFEMPKERLTPQEAKDLVKAVEELEKKPSKGAYFDNRAYVLLASGKVKEALAEDRRLIALHPKEALHRSELAFSLISVGLGEAARKEAAQAIALDPSSSFAWSSQGFVLEHDIIGREYHKGFDRAGAIKTYEKAVSIDPKDPIPHFHLGVLHEYNDEGVRYAGGAEFDAALKEYRTLQDLPNKPGNSDEALLYCLYFSGHFDEAITKGMTLKQTPETLGLRVAATAISKNPEAALELAQGQAADIKDRSEALIQASRFLIRLRHYPEAAKVEAAGVEISEHPASRAEHLETLRHTRHYEEVLAPKSDPKSAVERVFLAAYGKGKSAPIDLFSPLVINDRDRAEAAIERDFGRMSLPRGFEGYSDDVVLDWILSNFYYSVDGNDKTGYRIGARRGSTQSTAFVVREDGDWKLLTFGHNLGPLGLAALSAINHGDLDTARQWIDWARDEMEVRTTDDALAGPVFPKIWHKGQQADRSMLEKVAAVLVSGSEWSASSISILQRAVADTKTDDERTNFQLALCSALTRTEAWHELASIAGKLESANPRSGTAFHYLAAAYIHLEQWADVERIVHERLSRLPDDRTARRDLARAQIMQGKMEQAHQTLKSLIDVNHLSPEDLNGYAWSALFIKSGEPEAIDVAQRANNLTNRRSYAILHTLACLYADNGKEREARETLLQAMQAAHISVPDDGIWFGLGLIADEYGEQGAALAAYDRVKRPNKPEMEPDSTWSLAQERIRVLSREAQKTASISVPMPSAR